MLQRHHWLIVFTFLLLHFSRGPAFAQSRTEDSVKALVARIDRIVETRWAREKVRPSTPADNSTYVRRVYLDVTGRIPSLTAARDFIEDPSPDKRLALVERLLKTQAHAHHFAVITRKAFLPEGTANDTVSGPLDEWLEKKLRANVRYDRLAREVIAAPISATGASSGIGIFYQTNQYKPENLAANVSRIFLGVRLECAQCHDHPFASYKRKDFWEFAAFFSGVGRTADGSASRRAGEITIPMTGKVVQARLPGEAAPKKLAADPREELSDWLARKENPYFARAIVNRMWAHFFGLGLVEPIEEMGDQNEPSYPEVLEALARSFVDQGFDLRFLIRVITATRAYQLSSLASNPPKADLRLLARMAVRGLSAEELYDSVAEATWKSTGDQRNAAVGPRNQFLGQFATHDRAIDPQASILQALHMMNGKPLADAISFENNRALRALAEVKGRSTAECVEELYLMTFARKPRSEETTRLVKYIDGGGPQRDRRKALSDVLWALLNSPEFMLNH